MNENKGMSIAITEEIESEDLEGLDEINDTPLEMREENIEPFEDETDEMADSPIPEPVLPGKAKKHIRTMHLIQKTKKMLKDTHDREEACKRQLEKDIKAYEDAKSRLKANGLDACVSLVKKLGYETNNDDLEEKETAEFSPNKAFTPLVLKDISSGRLTGFLYALLGGGITAVGLVYLATEKLDMVLDMTKVPSEDQIQSILAWFSTLVGLHEDVNIGAAVLSFSVILVMLPIYITRVYLKKRNNLHLAVKQFIEAELYIEKKSNCKMEIDKITMHIRDAIGVMRTYEVILNEQKGKLERIHYVEGEREKGTEYHYKSYAEILETKEVIRAIMEYMNTPITVEGKLSEKSVLLLQHAKDQADKMLKRFY
ncbi:hypothetical protein MN086_02980 [Sulfurovum sp. XGS-02]|uniref:hypothetical protein n=1 Tax=Sulfurovum sp. XGS-02 TaxID=2925411 RepID=UPI00206B1DBB|nr:hypothetical protein [Sulfurovum sp. XGS-02]UPT78117.1 hypothetical protein MN086_02980 [Sulfurovum sp. XGS-02]